MLPIGWWMSDREGGSSLNALFLEYLKELEPRLRTLPDKPEETAESTLRALWITASGSPVSANRATAIDLPALTEHQIEALEKMIGQRLGSVPLGHITGRQMFMGLEFEVSPDALLPRRETEILARGAIEILGEVINDNRRAVVVDTCCGSGNVALAVAHHVPTAEVVGVDISPEAIQLAKANASAMALDDRVSFRIGDLLEPVRDLERGVDLLTCNPPYISSSRVGEMNPEISGHEPHLAFDGGPFGIKILNRLIKEAPPLLRHGGYLAFEVGLGQGEPIVVRLRKAGVFDLITELRDEAGNIRAITARIA
jgi:release factor glutamine methyltransferase